MRRDQAARNCFIGLWVGLLFAKVALAAHLPLFVDEAQTSLDDVDTISRYSRPRYFMSRNMLTPVTTRSRTPSTPTTKTMQVM